jgi:hypothetical protein
MSFSLIVLGVVLRDAYELSTVKLPDLSDGIFVVGIDQEEDLETVLLQLL